MATTILLHQIHQSVDGQIAPSIEEQMLVNWDDFLLARPMKIEKDQIGAAIFFNNEAIQKSLNGNPMIVRESLQEILDKVRAEKNPALQAKALPQPNKSPKADFKP